jgi:hypothetical protein
MEKKRYESIKRDQIKWGGTIHSSSSGYTIFGKDLNRFIHFIDQIVDIHIFGSNIALSNEYHMQETERLC